MVLAVALAGNIRSLPFIRLKLSYRWPSSPQGQTPSADQSGTEISHHPRRQVLHDEQLRTARDAARARASTLSYRFSLPRNGTVLIGDVLGNPPKIGLRSSARRRPMDDGPLRPPHGYGHLEHSG